MSPERLSRAYSIAFHLLSLVEQNAAIQQQRSTEAAHGPSALQALWGQSLEQLRDRGLTADQIAATLRRMQVELVLTAHPTEAKRTIVLEHHRSLYLLLVKRENQVWTPNEQRAIRDEFKTLLSLLWRTGEIFLHKPDVAAERRNVMHYLYSVFPGRPARARWPAASELGARGLRSGSAARSRTAAAVPSGHVGGRRSGRAPAGDAGRHARDARGSAAARVAAAPASARGARPAGEPVGSPGAAASGVERPRQRSRGRAQPGRARAAGDDIEAGETWRQFVDLMLAQLPLESVYPEGGRLRTGPAGTSTPPNSSRICGCSTSRSSPSAPGAWPTTPWRR